MNSEPKSVSNPVAIVQAAYQEISDSYAAWSETTRVEERARYNDVALALLPPGSRLLELGCGDGRLTSASLAGRYRLLGLDLAPRQVNAARHHVPDAEFRVADAFGSPVTFQWILAIRPDPESPHLAVLPDRASDMATAVASIRAV